jgi:hypothetical protein
MSKSREVANRNAETLDSKDSTDFAYDDMTNVGTLPSSVHAQLKGDTGNTGATGAAGAQGATGGTGPTGAAGGTGPTGAAGGQGSNGSNGPTGPTGPTGPAGSVAQDSGSTGTWSGSTSTTLSQGGQAGLQLNFGDYIQPASGHKWAFWRVSGVSGNTGPHPGGVSYGPQSFTSSQFRMLVGGAWYYMNPVKATSSDGSPTSFSLNGKRVTASYLNLVAPNPHPHGGPCSFGITVNMQLNN